MAKVKDEPKVGLAEILGGIKEWAQETAPGLSLEKIFHDIKTDVGPLVTHGRTEAAAALFSGGAFVMYMKQPEVDQTPLHGLTIEPMKQPEIEQSMGHEL